ncbi:hypothetical protein [Chryseobacterium koreense]|uniref:Uncharacterized protein n=1 Tax=Chryseobacterium koreense CCUG 49689 TaxID=1304281 RepID=A0A0J7LJ51_9FLAO|nr:hypothetical protein [Chryseobacterium koreense]KMQ69070.1 hypothetical protein ACM44_14560 [Chryseobacterium koreense CCUG 49689]MBB5334603.1 hypothetical protein [Chryseobacterium koreense]
MKTDKPTKKRQSYNTEIINAISVEFGVSTQFVRQCIRKEKHSLTADTIAKKYHELCNPTKQALQHFKNNPI